MAVNDYNKKKKLEVTSQNDGGTTQDKAQPIILRGNDYTGVDGFESGSSQLGWESHSGFSIDTNSEVYLNNSLKCNSNNEVVDASKTLNSNISSDNKKITFSIKIDNQFSSGNDFFQISFEDGFTRAAKIRFEHGTGDIEDIQGNTVGSWSAGVVYDVEIVFDFTNNTYDIVIDGVTEASNISFLNNVSKIDTLDINNTTDDDLGTVNAFIDRLTYTAPVEDTVNAGGDIGVDWTNIGGESDIAIYDQNGNLLPYEIESFDDAAETATLWCYNSWTRDDSVRAQVVYGDGPTSSEENVTGTWDNTGQDTYRRHNLNSVGDGTAEDSTSNDRDGTITGATSADGEFANAVSGDGVDDEIDTSEIVDLQTTNRAISFWYKTTESTNVASIFGNRFDGGDSDFSFQINDGSDQNIRWVRFDGNSALLGANPSDYADGNWHHVVLKQTSNGGEIFYDGNSINSDNNTLTSYSASGEDNFKVLARNNLGSTERFFPGEVDEFKTYNSEISPEWVQAEFDASPKAGQVYFSQQAAENTSQPTTLSGSASSTATATGTLQTNRLLSGTATATSTDTGVLTTVDNRVLSGTATSTATANGTLTTVDNRVLSGTATSAANLTGSLINANFLSGSFTSNASATGNLTTFDERTLSGNLSGAATATGNFTTLTEATFSGTATGQATANGLLTLVEPKDLSGTATSTATATGNLTAFDERILSSTATSTADLTGSLINANFLSGSLLSESTATGNLTTLDERILSGSLSAQSTAAGTLQNLVSVTLSGDAQGNATISGTLSDELTLSGAAGMEGNVSGVILAQRSLEGLAEAKAEAQGDITLFVSEEKRYREFTPQKMATVGRQNALAFLNRIDDPNDRYNGDYIYRSMPRTKSQEFGGYPFIVLEGYTFNDIGDTKNGLLSQFDFDIEFHVYGLENSDDDIEAIDAILDEVNYMVKGKPQLRLARGAELTRPQFIRQNRFTGIQQKDQPIVRYEVEVRGKLHLDMEALE